MAHRLTTGANAAGDSADDIRDFSMEFSVSPSIPEREGFPTSSAIARSNGSLGLSRDNIARMGHSEGCTGDPGFSSESAAALNSARRNGCSSGYRRKNSAPVTRRRLAPPATGAELPELPYPHVFVTSDAYARVAPFRTSQCGDLKPRTQTVIPAATNAVVSVASSVRLNAWRSTLKAWTWGTWTPSEVPLAPPPARTCSPSSACVGVDSR